MGINGTSGVKNVDKSITSNILNEGEIVGLASVKDQLRIIFDIIDAKRHRKLFKRDCLIAMAVNGIARKLIASIPILKSFLYPNHFHQLYNDILKRNKNVNKFITFEDLLQFVLHGGNHNDGN